LVGLDGEIAVRAEVLRGPPPELGSLVAPEPFPVLVETVEEPGRPAAVPLEKADAQAGEALEDAAGSQADRHQHDPERLTEGAPHHQLVEHLEREVGSEPRLPSAVERDRDREALALGPERVVVRVVPWAAADAAGREEDRPEAELLDGAAR